MPIGIELEPPVVDNPSVPPVAADYADHLPLKFSSKSLVWVSALPFLAWVAELVVAPDMPTFYLLPMVALEALLLPLCLGSNGLAEKMLDTHMLNLRPILRILKALRKGGIQLSPMRSHRVFLDRARIIIRELDDLDVLKLQPNDLWQTVARHGNYVGEARWFQHVSWIRVLQNPFVAAAAGKLLEFIGDRKSRDRSRDGSRAQVTMAIVGTAFDLSVKALPLPISMKGNQVLSWFTSLQWPRDLFVPVASADEAAEELVRAMRYEASNAEGRAEILAEVFERILDCCPNMQALRQQSEPSSALAIMQPMLKELGLPAAPKLEDYRLVDGKLSLSPANLLHLVQELGAEEPDFDARLRIKVRAVLKELTDSAQLDTRSKVTSVLTTPTDAAESAADQKFVECSVNSLHELRRSSAVKAVLSRVQLELDEEEPSRNKLLALCIQSRISALVRYAVGVIRKLDVFEIFHSLQPYMLRYSGSTLKEANLEPLCIYLGWMVTKHLHKKYPLLKTFRLGRACAKVLFAGPWTDEDWPQRLIYDVNDWRMGRGEHIDLDYRRPKEHWFSSESELIDFVEPWSVLMFAIGYPERDTGDNSAAAIFEQAAEGFKFARNNPPSQASVRMKARRGTLYSIRDACDAYMAFIGSDSAVAKFPQSWLPMSSECMTPLQDAMASTDRFIEFAAHIPEVADRILGQPSLQPAEKQQPNPAVAASKRPRAVELEELEEKPIKLKKGFPSPYVTCGISECICEPFLWCVRRSLLYSQSMLPIYPA